jgi:hypothetical protein
MNLLGFAKGHCIFGSVINTDAKCLKILSYPVFSTCAKPQGQPMVRAFIAPLKCLL